MDFDCGPDIAGDYQLGWERAEHDLRIQEYQSRLPFPLYLKVVKCTEEECATTFCLGYHSAMIAKGGEGHRFRMIFGIPQPRPKCRHRWQREYP